MKIFISFLAAALIAASACTTGSGGGILSDEITLEVDKTSLLADGNDAVRFTVTENRGYTDVTSDAVIKTDGKATGNLFSTEVPGTYVFTAEYGGTLSNSVIVTAVAPDAEGITLNASKTSLYPDGGDFVTFSLTDKDGNDVTELGTFFADGEALEGNRFSTLKGSLTPVTVSAEFSGRKVANTVAVTATSSYAFSSRLLLEEITRTSCQYCPIAINVISALSSDVPQSVIAYNVHNTVSSVYQTEYSEMTRDFADQFCRLMNETGSDYLTAAPKTYVSRSRSSINAHNLDAAKLRAEAGALPKDVAIAVETAAKAGNLSLRIAIGSKKTFAGKVVAVLVENGIYAEQSALGRIEMYRIMRAYAPSVTGQPVSIVSGKACALELEFNLAELSIKNIANCEVIVFVTDDADGLCENVQCVKVGESRGY